MTRPLNYLAVDLGAESGRAMLGSFDGNRLAMKEVHRFGNGPVRVPDKAGKTNLHWDILRLFAQSKEGLARAVGQCDGDLASVGLDSWGVDFGLLDRSGGLVGNPYHHRDSRTDGMIDQAFRRVPREVIFQQTGIQFLQINSLYQLLSMVISGSPALESAEMFLTIPDLLNYWLTGTAVSEYTNATTTQCYNATAKGWAEPLLAKMGIPSRIFPDVVLPGSQLGQLRPAVAEEAGIAGSKCLQVIAPACHDTGSAAVAVPAKGPGFAWISSGTWSTLGAECLQPVINDQSLAYNFTNEGGVCGTFRLLRNVMGLWLVQESAASGSGTVSCSPSRSSYVWRPRPLHFERWSTPTILRFSSPGTCHCASRSFAAGQGKRSRSGRGRSYGAYSRAWLSNTALCWSIWTTLWAGGLTPSISSEVVLRTSF